LYVLLLAEVIINLEGKTFYCLDKAKFSINCKLRAYWHCFNKIESWIKTVMTSMTLLMMVMTLMTLKNIFLNQ